MLFQGALSRMRWGRIVLASALALLAGALVIMLVVAGYAFKLGFEARGAPDQARIEQFAREVGPVGGPIASVLFTLLAAIWATRAAVTRQALHGTLVGLLVGCLQLLLGRMRISSIVAAGLSVLVGYLGGKIGGRNREVRSTSSPGDGKR